MSTENYKGVCKFMKRFASMLMALVMLVNMVPVALAAESTHGNPETHAETSNDDPVLKKTLIDSVAPQNTP